uniref:Uncharacterized protein n=1 Tax=Oryza sativa subsp. japonica TaxID=39947 RepID=Q2R4S3_ORYSJ|nr:hypothetical protein LOC_Os11g27490 [Oryza sativa Japonica Group]
MGAGIGINPRVIRRGPRCERTGVDRVHKKWAPRISSSNGVDPPCTETTRWSMGLPCGPATSMVRATTGMRRHNRLAASASLMVTTGDHSTRRRHKRRRKGRGKGKGPHRAPKQGRLRCAGLGDGEMAATPLVVAVRTKIRGSRRRQRGSRGASVPGEQWRMGWADLVRRDGERPGRMGELIRRGVKGIPVTRSFEE